MVTSQRYGIFDLRTRWRMTKGIKAKTKQTGISTCGDIGMWDVDGQGHQPLHVSGHRQISQVVLQILLLCGHQSGLNSVIFSAESLWSRDSRVKMKKKAHFRVVSCGVWPPLRRPCWIPEGWWIWPTKKESKNQASQRFHFIETMLAHKKHFFFFKNTIN